MKGGECIYCGEIVAKYSEEHIVPEALGGSRIIAGVCKACNEGVLSNIDQELCSKSPLSLVATREIEKPLLRFWDVDHAANGLLVEGQYDKEADAFHSYPQIIFEPTGNHIRGDYDEVRSVGQKEFQRVVIESVLRSFQAFETGKKKRLFPERIKSPLIEEKYRYPPRIFVRRSIREIKDKENFVLRYLKEEDKQFVLKQLSTWDPSKSFKNFGVSQLTTEPEVRFVFEQVKVIRGLAKLGLNLLIDCCSRTQINTRTFGPTIKFIRGETMAPRGLPDNNGFVIPSCLDAMGSREDCHLFWLIHDESRRIWSVFASYFGGKVHSLVSFPGPNSESWNFMEVRVPLKEPKDKWLYDERAVLPSLQPRIEWQDCAAIIPSIPLKNFRTKVITERRRRSAMAN